MINDNAAPTTPHDFGKHLFTFAVVADSHVNEEEDVCSSPFEVNRKANARLRYVIDRLERQKPAFVIHLGDLIHPVPALRSYAEAAGNFHEQVSHSSYKWHLVPGNHDVGDKPLCWAPAATVRDEYLALWEQHFGPHYYHIDHADCRLIVINASIINSGLLAEAEQAKWLEDLLAASSEYRVVVCIHYPPYINSPDEAEHYDNIAEPGRTWLLALLERYEVEILLAGHVHNFWYYRHSKTDCYLLPSTAFVRQDYSEMYRISPGPEGGRDDAAKLGYFLVAVHEGGIICHMQRTNGEMRPPERLGEPFPETITGLHSSENERSPLGFEFRGAWAEESEIPPSGGVDEFVRKRVRNDYPLLALWEMGVRRHLIPVQDVLDPRLRERMRIMRRMGHSFVLQSFARAEENVLAAVTDNADLVDGWVLAVSPKMVDDGLAEVDRILTAVPTPIYLSRLLEEGDIRNQDGKYYHVIAHGFAASDQPLIDTWCSNRARPIAGAVFRILGDESPEQAIRDAAASAAALGLLPVMYMRQSGSFNPAAVSEDERHSANRIAEALFAATCYRDVTVYVDTFSDVDRSYFRRVGVVDRRYNPKPAGRLIRHLYGALNASVEPLAPIHAEVAGWNGRVFASQGDSQTFVLLLPGENPSIGELYCPALLAKGASILRRIDLESGEVFGETWESGSTDGTGVIRFRRRQQCRAPALLQFDHT